jgi:hypothetical protein
MAYTISLREGRKLLTGIHCAIVRDDYFWDTVRCKRCSEFCNGSFGCCSVDTMYIQLFVMSIDNEQKHFTYERTCVVDVN